MINPNQQLYLNINYNHNSNQFEYDVDNYTWNDPVPCGFKPYFKTSNKYELKIWLDLNGLRLHKRIIIQYSKYNLCSSSLRSYSLIRK